MEPRKIPCIWTPGAVRQYFDNPYYTGIVTDPYGDTAYFKDGKWHREDGPALVWESGDVSWWLCGQEYYFNVWCMKTNKTPEEILLLQITYGV